MIEQGITIGGKKLRDHLEAIDHYEAIRHVRELAARDAPFHAIGCAQPPRSGGETLGPWNRRRLRHVEPLCEYRQGPAYVPAAFGNPVVDGRFFRMASRRIIVWSIFILSTTAMAARRAF